MKYILLACCFLVGCSKPSTPPNEFTSSRPTSDPAAGVEVLPADVQAAIVVLLSDRPYPNEAEVQKAAKLLHSFEESVPGIVETLVSQSGEYSTAVTHAFPKAGITVDYHDGKVTGASRIEKKAETSNNQIQNIGTNAPNSDL